MTYYTDYVTISVSAYNVLKKALLLQIYRFCFYNNNGWHSIKGANTYARII